MNNGRKNRGWIVALTGAVLAVLVFLAAALVGVGIYHAPENRMKRLLDLGDKYLTAQEYEQAVAAYSKAIEIDSKDVDAYLGLAEAYKGMGDMNAAYEVLESGYKQTQDAGLFAVMQRMEDPERGQQAGDHSAEAEDAEEDPSDTGDREDADEVNDAGVAEGELVLDFRWDELSMGGTLANLTLALTGDEGTISARASDGGADHAQLLAQDGTPLLEIETADLGTEKSIRVTIRRTDGTYHLTLEDNESMELYGDQAGIGRSGVRIYLITSEGETELEREDYLYRYPTGYWTLEMDIDHGTVG